MASDKKTIMFLAAHPADPFDCAAGTIALHAEKGDRVVVVSVTPGARSHAPKVYGGDVQQNMTDERERELYEETVDVKKGEFREACEAVGAEMVCMDFVDEPFWPSKEVLVAIGDCYREYRPDLLVTHHKTELNNHDHPVVGEQAIRAVTSASRWLPGSRRPPHLVKDVFFFGQQFRRLPAVYHGANPLPFTHIVDIESVIETKILALRAFKSQAYAGMDYDSDEYIRSRIESIEGNYGLENGLKYGEIFYRLKPIITKALS